MKNKKGNVNENDIYEEDETDEKAQHDTFQKRQLCALLVCSYVPKK